MTMLEEPIILPEEPTAHLDSAHIGDIEGAWGTIQRDTLPTKDRTWLKRLLMLLVISGPGLITMVGDNDAGGIATYAQAGQNYGTSLLWVLLLLIPILIVNQEMVVRLGAVTGVGHARLIFARFGKFWGAFSVGDLFLLNFLTIVTEFIGFSQAMAYFGVSPYIAVPLGVTGLIAITITGSFRRWERVMWVCVAISLLMLPLAFFAHPTIGPIVRGTFIPSIQGGLNSTALLVIIAIVGTTVAPWQLFFQQSNVIDKRITPRWISQERTDTIIGAFVTNITAGALMIATAFAFAHTQFAGQFVDALTTAHALELSAGHVAGVIFAIILLNASIIGASAVTLSTSYAFGDVFNANHSLHRKFAEAKVFYGTYAAMIIGAAAIVLIPRAPLGLLTEAVQALAGVLLPSATVFLLLLCNDPAVLGPWVNKPWLNAVGAVIIGVLVMLSLILAAATLYPNLNAPLFTAIAGAALVVGLLGMGIMQLLKPRRPTQPLDTPVLDPAMWHMAPLETLPRPVWSTARKVGMLILRVYLIIAMVMLIVKVVQLALIH